MDSVKLTKVSEKDWKKIQELEEQASSPYFQPCDDEEGFKSYLRDSAVFVIENKEDAIGTISFKPFENDSVIINGLTVIPKYREKGIATTAMKLLLRKITKDMVLYVHPHNTPALIIYIQLGFKIIKWKENVFGNGEPRLFLKKEIST